MNKSIQNNLDVDENTLYNKLIKAYNGNSSEVVRALCKRLEEYMSEEDLEDFFTIVACNDIMEGRNYFIH